jgi:L-serine dehydratase
LASGTFISAVKHGKKYDTLEGGDVRMHSLRNLYRIGNGPSSSHTIAPQRAALAFRARYQDAASYRVILYGSLAATGKGHLTDVVVTAALTGETPEGHAAERPKGAPVGGRSESSGRVELLWKPKEELPPHPNGMKFEALDDKGRVIGETLEFSVGGGALLSDEAAGGTENSASASAALRAASQTAPAVAASQAPPSPAGAAAVYPAGTMAEILAFCEESGESFWEYVQRCEGKELWPFLERTWEAMCGAVDRGLETEGVLPGKLGLRRKAYSLYRKARLLGRDDFRSEAFVAAYAYAVAEENASGGIVVTAPTCGSSGVLPAVLYHLNGELKCRRDEILRALATAGLFGNLVKSNGSISGAVVGCQGEIGTACAMAAAAATQLFGGSPPQIEYAAEMGLEHHLGLTCDPVAGLVQIPCIERNAHAATRALSCCRFALLSDGLHRISFDDVVSVMVDTGKALPALFRETSSGGLAKVYEQRLGENIDAT